MSAIDPLISCQSESVLSIKNFKGTDTNGPMILVRNSILTVKTMDFLNIKNREPAHSLLTIFNTKGSISGISIMNDFATESTNPLIFVSKSILTMSNLNVTRVDTVILKATSASKLSIGDS